MTDKKPKAVASESRNPLKKVIANIKEGQQRGAQEQLLQDLFDTMYKDRKKVYKMNFVRGIFLVLGTAIGGTLVVALLIWVLSLFINAPVIGDFVRDVQNSINSSESAHDRQ